MLCEFEEKSFETLFNRELGFVLPPGQSAEAVLGYDAVAAPPAVHAVWAALGVPTIPVGTVLRPAHWTGAPTLPRSAQLFNGVVTSLVFQYKRPERMVSALAAQWSHWRSPYYRFEIGGHQQVLLELLEQNLGAYAVVRYASPCFHTQAELIRHAFGRSVIGETAFAPPAALSGHTCWTYVTPGVHGWANPEFEEVYAESIDDIMHRAERAEAEPLDRHLERIISAVDGVVPDIVPIGPTEDPLLVEALGDERIARRVQRARTARDGLAAMGLGWVLALTTR